jgi:hypothetical protein
MPFKPGMRTSSTRQAGRSGRVLQKFPGGREGLDLQSGGSDEAFGGATYRQIVINNEHDGCSLRHEVAFRATALCSPWGSGAEGKLNKKVAPGPWFGSAHSRPPCASIIERLIASPIPTPSFFVV